MRMPLRLLVAECAYRMCTVVSAPVPISYLPPGRPDSLQSGLGGMQRLRFVGSKIAISNVRTSRPKGFIIWFRAVLERIFPPSHQSMLSLPTLLLSYLNRIPPTNPMPMSNYARNI